MQICEIGGLTLYFRGMTRPKGMVRDHSDLPDHREAVALMASTAGLHCTNVEWRCAVEAGGRVGWRGLWEEGSIALSCLLRSNGRGRRLVERATVASAPRVR